MDNHLLVKGLSFQKSPEGEWLISRIATNYGIFSMGEYENSLLDKEVVDRFCSYTANELRGPLEEFLQEEAEAKQTGDSE